MEIRITADAEKGVLVVAKNAAGEETDSHAITPGTSDTITLSPDGSVELTEYVPPEHA